MKKSRIALIGAGAVGAYFICGLENADNIELSVIAEGKRLERLKSEGVLINGEIKRPDFKTPEEAGKQDLIMIATKYSGLESAAEMLPPMISEDTLVMSLLNGVDSEDYLAEKIGRQHIVHSFMRIGSMRDEKGIIFDTKLYCGVFYGVAFDETKKDAAKRIHEMFSGTDVFNEISDDIVRDMWIKYAGNISNNLPQAVLCAPAAMYTDSEHGYFLAEKLWEEVRKVALKKGVDIGEKVVIYDNCFRWSRYSTLQDLDALRKTEIDMFTGNLIKMAKEYGLEVPYAEYTHHAIKVLEEKNEGKFD